MISVKNKQDGSCERFMGLATWEMPNKYSYYNNFLKIIIMVIYVIVIIISDKIYII